MVASNAHTGFLFGHDLQTQLASIKASNKIGQATTSGVHMHNATPRRQFDKPKGSMSKGKTFSHGGKPFFWESRGRTYRPYQNKPKFPAKKKNQQ